NDERVVRAVAAATTPIVSAVGHQTDYTLSDFAADLRAATPSQASELVVPDRTDLLRRLRSAQYQLNQSLKHRLIRRRLRLERCLTSGLFRRPRELLRERVQALDQCQERLAAAIGKLVERKEQRWRIADEKLNMLNPLRVLQRGYSVVRHPDGKVVCKAENVRQGDELDIWLQEGRLGVVVTETEKVRRS
ncbi:MAG TPA: exodeoxyribonuclease VII large subunit, partial [Negativicutes bacterium]|nr:exodeoxyribonuclease VII large subunit [Negativicutes bacterium]